MRALYLMGAGVLLCATVACAPVSRFEWGNYENALYAYTKNAAARPAYEAALVGAIEKGRATGRVAPGLLAELGYLQLEDGKREDAIKSFQEEMLLFPESSAFMSSVIGKIRSGSSVAAVRNISMEAVS